jgi:YHS domain-containing protein
MFSQTIRASRRTFVAALACAAVLFPASVLRAEEAGGYNCPVLHNPIAKVTKETQFSDFKGVRYYYCCDGCKPQFDKDQAKFLKDDKNKGKVLGMALFDPVTTKRIESEKATAHTDYSGVRYFFADKGDQKIFAKEPKKFAVAPKKELLYCPVGDALVDSYATASDYSDYKDTRYFFCCAGCKPKFDKNPDQYLTGLETRVKSAQEKKAAEAPKPDAK